MGGLVNWPVARPVENSSTGDQPDYLLRTVADLLDRRGVVQNHRGLGSGLGRGAAPDIVPRRQSLRALSPPGGQQK